MQALGQAICMELPIVFWGKENTILMVKVSAHYKYIYKLEKYADPQL